jgi:phosphopantothenoylcysteine synthetase/decarboxylase
MKALNVLITAGPTREYIDPVRFISNASSGIMGYELAKAARISGHKVILVSGPVGIEAEKGVKVVKVVSALEMFKEVKKLYKKADIIIGCAAVADYRPAKKQKNKIKKTRGGLALKLVRNPDILQYVGRRKGKRAVAGFALESRDVLNSARTKFRAKNLDLIAANTVGSIGRYRACAWIMNSGNVFKFLKNRTKKQIAERIINETVRIRKSNSAD